AGPVDNDDANDEVDHAPSDDTHLPSDRGHDPSDPEHSPSDSDDRAGTVEQTDTDTNAPADVRQQDRTDDTEEDASDVSGPMIVPGRRDASPDAEPFEHPSTPLSGSSLWRDVVGIALDSDTKKSGYEVAPRHSQQQSRQAPWILIGALLVVILAAVLAITTITSALRGDRGTAPTGSAAESTAVVTHPEVPGDDVTVAVPSESMPSPTDLPVL
ncbi:MAG: hypothetical protein Q4G40_11790, partial [Brachybacterium sp.]|nr:hypothetical protein [Brachybacterium sp.]